MFRVNEASFENTLDAFKALVHPNDRQGMDANFRVFLDSGALHLEFAHRIVHPDGGVIHVRGSAEASDTRHMIQAARTRFPDMPVLYTSAYPKELIERDGRLASDIDLLPRPYRRVELAFRLCALLDTKSAASPGMRVQTDEA